MKTRRQIYGKEAAAILRDITTYRALTEKQLLRLYSVKPDKVEKILAHLVRQGRIFYDKSSNRYCACEDIAASIDDSLLAAVWVLADFIDRVDYHSVCDFPGKIIFFADGEVYEIVHIALGQETLISQILTSRQDDTSQYIILVDKAEQIAELQLSNVSGYCTVSADGIVQYYQKE